MNRIANSALIAAISVAAASSAAHAQSFGVSAIVPAYCEIDPSVLVADPDDGAASGTVFESCNTQEGFQVVAQHRLLEPNERVAFSYAGETTVLQPQGSSVVANRNGAKLGSRPIGIQYSGLVAPLSIALSITTL